MKETESSKVLTYFQNNAVPFDLLYERNQKWRYAINRLFRKGLFERVELTADVLKTLNHFTVLDVGCGSGRNSVIFADLADRVTGIDLSENMIDLAAALSEKYGKNSKCRFIKGDFTQFPFKEKFDAVVALGVFDYIAQPQAFLGRMMEGSRDYLIASFPRQSLFRQPLRTFRYALKNCPVLFYSFSELNNLCKEIGLAHYQIIPYDSGWLLVATHKQLERIREIGKRQSRSRMPRRFLKRALDLALSLTALIFLTPLVLALATLTRIFLGSPIFFRQRRTGWKGQIFTLYKFRSMTDRRNPQGQLLPDKDRLTPWGRFLRRTSLDELPELIHVLKGEMSLVGPRPLLVGYLGLYSSEQMRRHEVKPGLTGWAQIHGRNGPSWDEKFQLDLWYVDHRSLGLDLKILFLTLWKVLKCEGINQPGFETAEKFHGNKT